MRQLASGAGRRPFSRVLDWSGQVAENLRGDHSNIGRLKSNHVPLNSFNVPLSFAKYT